MDHSALTPQARISALREMSARELDVLVVGGGVTGAGTALEAATRGLETGLVEAEDWASGTSQWSSKLVHGGLRYLYQLDFALVAEALRERGLLLSRIAPHLVKPQPFLWPLRTPVVERPYSMLGVGVYDLLGKLGHGRPGALPRQRHYTKAGALKMFPGVREDSMVGAIRFFDARVDDARLVLALVRTAQAAGAHVASRAKVVDFVTEGDRIVGAVVVDQENGSRHTVRARYVITATGVWTEQTQNMAANGVGLRVLASKGIHIVVPRDRIDGETGLFLRTEKSVLFMIPWDHHWIIGTTDTAWHEDISHPVVTSADIDYVLDQTNAVLTRPLTRDDIIGSYAGLRPLLQPKTKGPVASTKVSREHTVIEVQPGMAAIAGGKLTTYRVMAQDAVDFALDHTPGGWTQRACPSVTHTLPLVGGTRYDVWRARTDDLARRGSLTKEQVQHLLSRYGDEVPVLIDMIRAEPDLARPLAAAPSYLRVEVAFAASHEGVLHLADLLRRRVRLDIESRDRGLSAADEVAELLAPRLDWDAERTATEIARYRRYVATMSSAEMHATDAAAVRAAAEVRAGPDSGSLEYPSTL